MACEQGRRELAGATVRLDGPRVLVSVGAATHALPLPPVGPPPGSPGDGSPGPSTWTDVTLHLAPDGRLWVERVDWEDVHLAGRWPTATWWLVSEDGATWALAEPPADRGPVLGAASS